ncbi:MAG: flagellar biosynthetic protein FliO [Thermodesulfobacteriota bacterium]
MESETVNLYSELFKTIGMLAIVLGLIVAVLYFIKKYALKASPGSGKSEFRLLSSFHLGNREKLVMIEVENEKLLLGVTQNSISLLSKYENSDEDQNGENGNDSVKNDFSKFLSGSLKKHFSIKKDKKS